MPIPLGVLAVAGAGAVSVPSDYDFLQTTIVNSTTASVTFSNLNNFSAYRHLQFRMSLQTTGASLYMFLNNDTNGANYNGHEMWGDGSSVRSQMDAGRAFGGRIAVNNSGDYFSPVIVDLYNFQDTTTNTTGRIVSGASTEVNLISGLWLNTAAITSATFTAQTGFGDIAAKTRISLYGIK